MEKKKILLIDDEKQVLRALERELREFVEEKGLELLAFDSSIIALEHIEKEHKDIAIIVSDQKMPMMKGCDLLNIVKGINPDIVLFLLTAHTDIGDIIKTIRAGLFSLIMKPWNIDSLMLELEKGLDLYRIRRENRLHVSRLNEELSWGGQLQRRLLYKELPKNEKAALTVNYAPLPEFHCGGDYYDVITIDQNRFIVLIGDVSGHGIKAAFITFILKTLVNEAAAWKRKKGLLSPSSFLHWLNNRICKELESIESMLISFSACLFDLEKHTILIANAGQVPVKIIREEQVLTINLGGTALGFQEDIPYEDHSEEIKPGDRVVLSTDGLTERGYKGSSYDDILIAHHKDEEFTDAVVHSVRHISSENQRMDDMTLISVEIFS